MNNIIKPKKLYKKLTSLLVIAAFLVILILPPHLTQAQTVLNLPRPGTMIQMSSAYTPTLIMGMTYTS